MPNIYTGRDFTDVKCHPEKLDIPLRWTKPRRIFVNSMSDLFHEDVSDSFIIDVFNIMAQAKQHIFQVLTKRPERMREFFLGSNGAGANALPISNVWLGVSCEDQATADERIPPLLQTPAAVRWVSAEPLLGPIDLWPWIKINLPSRWPRHAYTPRGPFINWIVAGGESGPQARPMHPDWVRSIRDQCRASGARFFFKQWGEWKPVCAQYPETDIEHDETEQAGCVGDIALEPDGIIVEGYQPRSKRTWLMDKVGKKSAGRTLDGRTWDEYPA